MIEVLVAVVLLGIGGGATLTALASSIHGSSVHETKIVGLSVLGSAASGLTEQVVPCSSESYQGAARAAIVSDGWDPGALGAVENLTAVADCTSDLHLVELTYTAPNDRGDAIVRLTIGGPTLASSTAQSSDDDEPLPVGDPSCRIETVSADPAAMTWNHPDRTLDQDVTIAVGISGNCADVRAALIPADGTDMYLPLNEVSATSRVLVVEGRQHTWDEGPVTVRFQHDADGTIEWTPMNDGASFAAFVVDECVLTDVTATPTSVALHDSGDGQLAESVTVIAAAGGMCDDLALSTATGVDDIFASEPMSFAEASVTGTLRGHPDGQPWATGTKTAEVIDQHGDVVGTANFDVVEAVSP